MKSAVVLACDDNFIAYTSVVARRIARLSTERFPLIVISDGVSDDNKRLAQGFCSQISFIEAGSHLNEMKLPERGAFTRAAYLRLFLDAILSDFDRAVYLDSDLSPLTNPFPLFQISPKAAPLVAAYDLSITISQARPSRLGMKGAYFNSGVMVLDLRALRKEQILQEALAFALDHADLCSGADQDPLNAVLDGRWQVLDWRWNVLSNLKEMMPTAGFIRHFARYKPWAKKKVGIEKRFIDEWRSDLAASPWPNRFKEQSLKYPIRQAFQRVTSAALYASVERRRRQEEHRRAVAKALASIEHAAASGALATPLFTDVELQALKR